MKQPGVEGVTRSNQNLVRFGGFTGSANWEGKDPNDNLILHILSIDKDFIPFFKMKMLQGASFTNAPNDTAHFILNEAAVAVTGIKDPIGKAFSMQGIKGTIIGVVKDFHYASMREKITPAAFYYHPQYFNRMYIRVTGKDPAKAVAAAQEQFKLYNGQYPFTYAFLDETFDSIYRAESRQAILFDYFSAIAIFISCLGLLGLATFTAQVRVREIGVRKVLGASVANITRMLSMDFLKLVVIAILVATPVAWYLVNNWLQDFAYRINIQCWVFVVAGVLAILIALMTISFQAIKAALANPVKSLRSE
jgi:putative ABC transport system permease protein